MYACHSLYSDLTYELTYKLLARETILNSNFENFSEITTRLNEPK